MVYRQMSLEPRPDGGRVVPEVATDAIGIGSASLVAPLVQGGHRDAKELGDLLG
jgi:hypothetical protein